MNPCVAPTKKSHFLQSPLAKFILLFVVLGGGIYLCLRNADVDGQKPEAREQLQTPTTRVILLTGFEPFGKDRPPNPSWEAIKDLDGQPWKDFQLVCKQLPVTWGAPMEHLREWINVHEPVAVFSFGQGGTGSFAFESKASNERGKIKDNEDKLPAAARIIEDGPANLDATAACEKFKNALSDKGYPVRVSTAAGRYLCEETLYTLEYLKSTKKLDATVMFCHVPPLKTKIGDQEVTADYVQQFVKDVLFVWHTNYQAEDTKARQRDNADVKALVVKYFGTWSNQDIKGYDSCFMREATIQHIDAEGRLSTSARPDFIAGQREYHRTSPDKTVEVPETIDIRFDAKLAHVTVFWKLTAGRRTEYGYDHFTLLRTENGWRIVNLVYYGTPVTAKKAGK